jgi:hypothetical protein
LSGLGLDTNVALNSLNLDQILTAFGINPTADVGLGTFLGDVGLSGLLSDKLGTLLNSLGLLSGPSGVLTDLNSILGGILPGTVAALLTSLGLNPDALLSVTNLEDALNNVTVGGLLTGQSVNDSLSSILTALGVDGVTPSGLTIGGLLDALGFSSATTGQLTLGSLLGDLGTVANPLLGLNITDLLNGLNLGNLLGDLGLSNLPLDLSNLGDLSNLTLGGLLGDLGLGDLANVSVEPLGGFDTLLVDLVPQQILASLGM